MVLNQKCQNKVKSYLCSSAAASAEPREEEETRQPTTANSWQKVCRGCGTHSLQTTSTVRQASSVLKLISLLPESCQKYNRVALSDSITRLRWSHKKAADVWRAFSWEEDDGGWRMYPILDVALCWCCPSFIPNLLFLPEGLIGNTDSSRLFPWRLLNNRKTSPSFYEGNPSRVSPVLRCCDTHPTFFLSGDSRPWLSPNEVNETEG